MRRLIINNIDDVLFISTTRSVASEIYAAGELYTGFLKKLISIITVTKASATPCDLGAFKCL